MNFKWDSKKADINKKKHGITFQEASSVFGDPLAITFADPDHSVNEQRHMTFGLSKYDRLLVVSHSDQEGWTRIISARLMTRQERKIYEEG